MNIKTFLDCLSSNCELGDGFESFQWAVGTNIDNSKILAACKNPYGYMSKASDEIFTKTGGRCPMCNSKSRLRIWNLNLFMKPSCEYEENVEPDEDGYYPQDLDEERFNLFIEQLQLMDYRNHCLIDKENSLFPKISQSTAGRNKRFICLEVEVPVCPNYDDEDCLWDATVTLYEYYCSYL